MKQRPQHIATHMSKYFPVFYYTGALGINDDKVKGIEKVKENLFLINDGINGNSIFDVRKKIIYTFWVIDHYFYVKDDQDSFVIYDYLDEIDITPRFNEKTTLLHKLMLKRADLILTSSDNLYAKVPDEYKEKTLLITNGVDVEHFHVKKSHNTEAKKEQYTIGFYGALEKWIDIDIIKKIAQKENLKIKLIGPVIDPKFQSLERYDNVEMLGHQPYDKLPLLTKDVDVFILPFKVNELTKSVSPVKLYEYFATGKPVVATALPECMKYDTVMIMDKDSCIEQIDKAIEFIGNETYMQKSLAYAKENSWDRKVEKIANAISDKLLKI
jgi:glycosyltransferase involved in cell wall biosynthesis